jgi:hypothetical protein
MSDTALRKELIRLAHAKPELRADILPLLGKTAAVPEKTIPLKGEFHQGADGSLTLTITPKAGGSALAATFKRFKNAYNQKKLEVAVSDEGGLTIRLAKAGADETPE